MQPSQDEIIQQLSRTSRRLSKSHRRIAAFIADNYEKAAFMTASRLSEAVQVSESTVVRFAIALGYAGYPELQQNLQELTRHRLTAAQRFALSAEMDERDVLPTVLKADMANIRATVEENDGEAFLRAVALISQARRLFVLGLRSAAPLAEFAAYYLRYIFDDVRSVSSGSADVFEAISRVQPGDVLLGISFPRYSSRTVEAMAFARSRRAQVIGLTDGPMSPLHAVADVCLTVHTDMASFVDSMAAPMSLINALLVALGRKNSAVLSERLQQLEDVWDAHSVYTNENK